MREAVLRRGGLTVARAAHQLRQGLGQEADLLVEAGEQVEEGTPIYVIATEKVEQEIEAGASGTVHWTGQVGTTYDIGTEIGVITS